MCAMAWPLPEGGLQETGGCAARRMWRSAVGALARPAADTDAAWQRVLDDSPPDSVWHSLRNCVAYQAGVWQNLLNKGIDDVIQPAAFKLAIVLRHTPSDVTVKVLTEVLHQHPQSQDLTSYILALLTDDEPIWCGASSSSISPSPTASGISATSGEEGDSADDGEGEDSADGGESGEGRESADSGESGDSDDSGDSADSEDSADSGGSVNSVEGAEVQVNVVSKAPVDDRRIDDLCDSAMVPDSTTGADSTTGPDYEVIVRRVTTSNSGEVAVGEVTEGKAAAEAAAAAAAEAARAAEAAEAAEAEAVVDSTESNADLELAFGGEALGEAIAAIVSGAAACTPAGPAPLRDLQLFGDCELAVLAASREEYDAHAKLIRAEYSKLTNENYVELRIKVLNQFAKIPKLYHTPEFECFESTARENIEREIGTLQEHLLTGRLD